MAVQLPFFLDEPAQTYTVALDGVLYGIRLVWRARTASWYLDLADADGVWLLRGRRLSPGSSPNAGVITSGPPGWLWVVASDPYAQDEIQLWYYSAEEVASAAPVEDLPAVVVSGPRASP